MSLYNLSSAFDLTMLRISPHLSLHPLMATVETVWSLINLSHWHGLLARLGSRGSGSREGGHIRMVLKSDIGNHDFQVQILFSDFVAKEFLREVGHAYIYALHFVSQIDSITMEPRLYHGGYYAVHICNNIML